MGGDNESLSILLSDMNPWLFSDSLSADPASYEDWLEIVGRIVKDETIEEEQMILVAIEYVRWFSNEFGYNLDDVLNLLTDNSKISDEFHTMSLKYYESKIGDANGQIMVSGEKENRHNQKRYGKYFNVNVEQVKSKK